MNVASIVKNDRGSGSDNRCWWVVRQVRKGYYLTTGVALRSWAGGGGVNTGIRDSAEE